MIIRNFALSLLSLFIFFTSSLYSQYDPGELPLKEIKNIQDINENTSVSALGTFAVLFPLNPIFLIENKKFYVGITKEFSLSFFLTEGWQRSIH